ncbi:MAG: hypothetical protein KAT48_04010, partial [Bacteroidales bacterium]|nr:hypothetical protein [Bacteroidales bacterium]
VSDRMINLVDIFATVQELVGGEVLPPEEAGADSFSFYDELIGERDISAVRPHMMVNNMEGVMAIRKGPWKYIEGVAAGPLKEGVGKGVLRQLEPQLYNLDKDISETKNSIHDRPDIHEDLQYTLDRIRAVNSNKVSNGKLKC